MKSTLLTLMGAAVIGLTACIPSVHPFYTAKDVVFDPALLGQWAATDSEDQPERWTFKRNDEDPADRAYRLTVTDNDGRQGRFRATLFQLKEHRFLDLIPLDCDYAKNQADLVGCSMFPGHLLVHIAEIDPELSVAFSDFDWLEDYLKEKPGALPHYTEDNRILLTASTKQLQRFVLKHVDGGKLFSEHGRLKRDNPTGR